MFRILCCTETAALPSGRVVQHRSGLWDPLNETALGSSFRPEQTFDTTHNFTWISTDESLAFRRQHSISAWYPFDKYTVVTTLEVFSGDNSTALPVSFLHLYGGLSGFHVEIKSIDHVKTSRSDQALYVIVTIQVHLFALSSGDDLRANLAMRSVASE